MVNLAQSTFNVTQGLATLTLELRDGRVPDAVVFLDGNNEVAPAFQSGRPGRVLNQDIIAAEIRGPRPTVATRIARSSELVQRISRFLNPDAVRLAAPSPDEICPGVAETYLGALSVIESLGSSFGFETLFFWQPMLAVTGKELTPYERAQRSEGGWEETVAVCTRLTEAEAQRRGLESFASLGGLFDDQVETVFIDDYGHVTESGNRRIAEAILEPLRPILRPGR